MLRALDFLKLRLEGGGSGWRVFWIILVGIALVSPTLWDGFSQDDYFFLMIFKGAPGLVGAPSSPLDTFSFWKGLGDREALSEAGLFPWWTTADWQVSFWRPLSSISLWLDYTLFGERAWVMHLHSLLLYALVGVVVFVLYGRFTKTRWVVALALLLFMVDSGHALPAAWLSQRNSLQALLFGLLALLSHDRWRRLDGRWYPHGALAIFWLGLALLSGESAVSVGAYLFAYALFMEPACEEIEPGARRFLRGFGALLPYLVVTVVWRVIYVWLGHGTTGSWLYTDPVANFSVFVTQVPAYLSVLLLGVFATPNSTLWGALLQPWSGIYFGCAVAFLFISGWVVWPMLREKRAARFWLVGAVVSALPYCATYPMDRNMAYPSVGALAVVAIFLGSYQGGASWLVGSSLRRLGVTVLAAILVFAHLVLSPVLATVGTQLLPIAQRISSETYRGLPERLPETDRLIAVNGPADLVCSFLPIARSAEERPVLPHWVYLSAGADPVRVERVNERSLVVHTVRGFITRPATQIFRDYRTHPMPVGSRVALEGMSAEVIKASAAGNPLAARFEFAYPLEDARLHWVVWRDGGYFPFALPAVGESVEVPGIQLATLLRIGLGIDSAAGEGATD
jgi:hypothetical protein